MKRKHLDVHTSVLRSFGKKIEKSKGTTGPDLKSFVPPQPMSENFKMC